MTTKGERLRDMTILSLITVLTATVIIGKINQTILENNKWTIIGILFAHALAYSLSDLIDRRVKE